MFLAHVLRIFLIFNYIKYTCFKHVFKYVIQAHVSQIEEQEDICFAFEQHL
jgi:hypothetical protein